MLDEPDQTEPLTRGLPRLQAALSSPQDLVTICLKCLEKDPNRRYGTA